MNAVERSTDAFANDLKRAVRHSEELLENTTEAVSEKACQVRQRITNAVRSARDTCCEVQQRSVEGQSGRKVCAKTPYQKVGQAEVRYSALLFL